MLGTISPEAEYVVGIIYGVVGTLGAIVTIMFVIVWVVPAILLAVEWARGR